MSQLANAMKRMLPDHMKFSANESLFVEMNFYISYRIEKQSVRRRSDFAALRNVLELTQNMRKPSYWSCPSNKKILVAASCSRAQAEHEELNHIDQWNKITANDNSNEEKSVPELKQNMRNLITSINGMKSLPTTTATKKSQLSK